MLPLDLYQGIESAWCPGCGNFGLLKAFKQALAELEIKPTHGPELETVMQAVGLSGYYEPQSRLSLMVLPSEWADTVKGRAALLWAAERMMP